MLAKNWKRILLIVLIIACLTNIIIKVICKNSLQDELQSAVDYVFAHPDENQEQVINNDKNEEVQNTETVVETAPEETDSNAVLINPFEMQ